MLERVAVDLGGRGQQELAPLALASPRALCVPERADLQRLDRQLQVVDRAGRAGKVEHEVHFALDVDVARHVVADELELAVTQVADVRQIAGPQVVDADDRVAAIEQASQRCDPMNPAAPVTTIGMGQVSARRRWKRPRTSVSHMIFRSSMIDQFSM